MTVTIACQGHEEVPYQTIRPFQGELKSISTRNLDKLKRNIAEEGFAAPLFVWRSEQEVYCIDGHQRLQALAGLEADGYEIPDVPVAVIHADTKKDARLKLLEIASQYGDVSLRGLETFAVGLDMAALKDKIRLMSNEAVLSAQGVGWNPVRYEDAKSDGIGDLVGYSLASFWKDIGTKNSPLAKYQLPLPANTHKQEIVHFKYLRTNLEEVERIIRTYMRPGDYFLESCCGWATFSSAAKGHGYSGDAVDIWDVSLEHSQRQVDAIPGEGVVKVFEGDAMALPMAEATYDVVYNNPPFMDQEAYSGKANDIADADHGRFLEKMARMQAENFRVTKPGGLCIVTINDHRKAKKLVPLHADVIAACEQVGFELHDFVVAEVVSQGLRMRKQAYAARRTVKCHEYVIVLKRPA